MAHILKLTADEVARGGGQGRGAGGAGSGGADKEIRTSRVVYDGADGCDVQVDAELMPLLEECVEEMHTEYSRAVKHSTVLYEVRRNPRGCLGVEVCSVVGCA